MKLLVKAQSFRVCEVVVDEEPGMRRFAPVETEGAPGPGRCSQSQPTISTDQFAHWGQFTRPTVTPNSHAQFAHLIRTPTLNTPTPNLHILFAPIISLNYVD